jgi:multidrug efflux pump subunit AcrB
MRRFLTMLLGNAVFANLLLAFIVLAGIIATARMVREIFPRFSLDLITVTVPYPGADPAEVEEGICLKLEEALEGIEGVRKVSTTAREGAGSALIELADSADVIDVKDEVENRVNAIVSFPLDAERPIIQELKFRGDVLCLAVWGQVPEYQLKELAREIQDELIALPEISQVDISGIRDYEIIVEVREAMLRRHGLGFDEVVRAVADHAVNLHGGTLKTRDEEIRIRTVGRRYAAEEYESIPVVTRADGATILLRQIATVRDGFDEEVSTAAYFNGVPAANINVYKTEEEDSLRISAAVERYLAAKRPSLPGTITVTMWRDNSRLVAERLTMLINNGLVGLALVFLSLWLFLDLRLSFWVTMGIPISLAGGLALMAVLGETLNMITLFGLIMVLGLIVDDAIVVGEAIYVQRREGKGDFQSAVEGTREVAWPVIAAVLTTIIAFMPLLFVSGVMGKFIRRIPIPVIAALSVSLIEALFILPVHLRHLPDFATRRVSRLTLMGEQFRSHFAGRLERFIERRYGPLVEALLAWRYVAIAVAVAILLLTLGLVGNGFVKFIFFPEVDEDFVRARIELPPGTPASETRAVADRLLAGWRQVEADCRREGRPRHGREMTVAVYTLVGGTIDERLGSVGNNFMEITIELLPAELRGVYFRDLTRRWEAATGPIANALSADFGSFGAGPGGSPVEVMFLARNQEQLVAAAAELRRHLEGFAGVFNIQMDHQPGKREIQARLRPEAAHLGLSTADLARHLNRGFYGDETLRIQRGRDEVKVRIRYPDADGRDSAGGFERIRLRTPGGAEIPLLGAADLILAESPHIIRRQQRLRTLTISAEVDNKVGNATEILRQLEGEFLPALVARHDGLRWSTEGQASEKRESVETLRIGFALALLGIFLIIATIFRSYLQPVIIMVVIPFGLVGAVGGHIILGLVRLEGPMPVTMMSFFGMVALAGIVVNDAIVLIEAVNGRLAAGASLGEALREGGKRRFRAIFLTTLTTFTGLTPIMLERSMQAQVLIPMAVAIAFGVAFASLLTLLLLPCLFLVLNDLRCLWGRLWHGQWPVSREAVEPRAAGNAPEPAH